MEKPDWIDQLKHIYSMRVVKMPRILQCLMYLLGFLRDEVCEPKTNVLFWKYASKFVG
jgi:hypothetical protein